MCGIIGIIGKGDAAPLLVEGLKRLEYRGYDSAGIATLVNGSIERRRAEGKIANLEKLLGEADRKQRARKRLLKQELEWIGRNPRGRQAKQKARVSAHDQNNSEPATGRLSA